LEEFTLGSRVRIVALAEDGKTAMNTVETERGDRQMDTLRTPRRDIDHAAPGSERNSLELAESTGGEGNSERTLSLRQTGSCLLWLVFAVSLCFAPAVAIAQDDVGEAPMNSHAKRYGDGWECDWAHENVDESCVAVQVPPNAHLDYFGNGWQCNRGYREVNGACAMVEIPANAFLDSRGSGWDCDRGYVEVGQHCVAIKVPANAYLVADPYGRGWEVRSRL
jgi:hypothetical protein